MEKIQGIGLANNVLRNSNKAKVNQTPILKQQADSVSFTGSKAQLKTPMSRVLDILGIRMGNIANQSVSPQVAAVWEMGDGVSVKDANSDLAQKLRSMTYLRQTKNYSNVTTRMYDEVAIKTIVKHHKQDPEFAEKLANVLKHSEYSNIEQLELIATHLKQNPEFVEGIYGSNFESPRRLALILESFDTNSGFVSQIMDLKSQDGYKKFSAYDISSMTQALEEVDEQTVLKYAKDSRIDLCSDDVIQLARLDAQNADQIEDLISFVSSNKLQKDARLVRISSLLTPYMEDPNATKGLMKMGVVRDDLIKQYTPAFNDIPRIISTILFKNHADSRMGFTIGEVVPYSYKFKQYEEQIRRAAGSKFEELSAAQLKSLIDRIERHAKQLSQILQGAV